jgi:hypothetical protein
LIFALSKSAVNVFEAWARHIAHPLPIHPTAANCPERLKMAHPDLLLRFELCGCAKMNVILDSAKSRSGKLNSDNGEFPCRLIRRAVSRVKRKEKMK